MISSPIEIGKDWLSSILGVHVVHVSARTNPAFNSSVTHLELDYLKQVTLPRNMLVKLNKDHEGQNEIQFYRFAEGLGLAMIPRRLGMEHDPESGLSFVILEDLSETHAAPVTREQLKTLHGVPAIEILNSIVDCIAGFHAKFWEHSQFGTIPDTTEMRWWYRDETFHREHLERRQREWSKFMELYQDEIPAAWVSLGEAALAKLPALFMRKIAPRLSSRRALTMSQGDCYLSQFLVPRAGFGPSYLIDFQDACVNFPAYDLVYMFATFWTREQRNAHEKSLLRRYQRQLMQRGVFYDWDQLCEDYRLCLSYMLFDAVWNAASGSAPEYWKPKMNCLVEAYQDWKCADL